MQISRIDLKVLKKVRKLEIKYGKVLDSLNPSDTSPKLQAGQQAKGIFFLIKLSFSTLKLKNVTFVSPDINCKIQPD